jgi:hypothetical protein
MILKIAQLSLAFSLSLSVEARLMRRSLSDWALDH